MKRGDGLRQIAEELFQLKLIDQACRTRLWERAKERDERPAILFIINQ